MMFQDSKHKVLLILLSMIGLAAGAATYYFLKPDPIMTTEEVHVHSDILVYIGDERLRFTDDKYQSASNQILHPDFHFHDNIDEVMHRHANGLTLVEFFQSLGFTLNNECLVSDTGVSYCNTDTEKVQLFVNGQVVSDIANYVSQEEDRIFLYYGSPANSQLQKYLSQITDQACIYSGTCPERGIAPPETCGLTCEL